MRYESPIKLMVKQMQAQEDAELEAGILKVVREVGFNVDKDELLRALRYDREQYQKGYHDRDAEIVRCKYCKHRYEYRTGSCPYFTVYGTSAPENWYCADGEWEMRCE